MRDRNKEFSKNIGDLMEEINNQDLENINGGQDSERYSHLGYVTCNQVISDPIECPPPELSSEAICGKFTSEIVKPVVSKLLDCN